MIKYCKNNGTLNVIDSAMNTINMILLTTEFVKHMHLFIEILKKCFISWIKYIENMNLEIRNTTLT